MTEKKFDVAAWLAEASLPEGEVTIYGDAAAVAALAAAEDESARADLEARVTASALTLRLRALTDAQRRELEAANERPDTEDLAELQDWDTKYACHLISLMAVSPELDASEVDAIRRAVTPSTFAHVVDAAGGLNRMNSADNPFSRGPSGASRR